MNLPLMSALGIALGTVIAASYPGDRTDEFALFVLAFGPTCRRRLSFLEACRFQREILNEEAGQT